MIKKSLDKLNTLGWFLFQNLFCLNLSSAYRYLHMNMLSLSLSLCVYYDLYEWDKMKEKGTKWVVLGNQFD